MVDVLPGLPTGLAPSAVIGGAAPASARRDSVLAGRAFLARAIAPITLSMQCSVVIPCHGGEALTRKCIASLLAQDGNPELEILLVDNGSTDATPQLDRMDPRVRVLRQERNLGFAGGVNVGLRAASMPFILVLNNDTQAATNLLQRLFAALAKDPRIGLAAPVSNYVKGPARLAVGDRGATATGRAELAAELAVACPG